MHKDHSARRATAYPCRARARRARLALVFALVSGAALLLAACGGGGGGGPPQVSLTSSQQPSYALNAIGASASGGVGEYQGQGVAVAVIDGEFDTGHPDLRGAFRTNPAGQVAGRNVREGHDDVRPVEQRIRNPRAGIAETASLDDKRKEEQEREADFSKAISHGTHVSGIIAARNNSIGTVGVAPRAEIVPIVLFRDYYVPRKYKKWSTATYEETSNRDARLTEAIEFANKQNVFVINNSWGRDARPTSVIQPNLGKYVYVYNWNPSPQFRHEYVFAADVVNAWENAAATGRVIVFAAGNNGWNSETGRVELYDKPIDANDRAASKATGSVPTTGLTYGFSDGRRIPIPENIPSLESSYFLTSPKLVGRWLAVVNVDRRNIISRYSNGCGIAKEYCLAAPGTYVQSTFASGEKYDQKDAASRAASKKRYGDADLGTGDGYGTYSGTSMAAPVVSGAAAVVKSRAPNLTARQVVEILLRTATDLGAPGTDPVYGRGLVNLARAVQAIGNTNTADRSGRAVAATGTTRIAFSSAFGNTASSTKHLFGGLDSYGRVYRYRAPLQDRVLPGPRLSGVLALNSPSQSHLIGRTKDTATYLRRSTDPESAIGDGSALSIIGTKTRIDLAVAQRRTSSLLSPAALLAGEKDAATAPHDWGVLAPQSRDLVSGGAAWQLSPRLSTGAYVSRALAEGATQRGESYGMTDLGLSARLGSAESGFSLHLGRLSEEGRFLGSKPEGGYALAGPTRSHYLRLSASHRVNNRLSVGLNMTRLRTKVDFRHDEFVADTDITARSAGMHLALSDAAMTGDRLVLHYGEPLAVTGGAIRQSSVMGYTAAGAYKSETRSLDLGVRARHRMAQVMYRARLADGVTGFAAAAHHRNWSHQRGRGNNLVMFGLSIQR